MIAIQDGQQLVGIFKIDPNLVVIRFCFQVSVLTLWVLSSKMADNMIADQKMVTKDHPLAREKFLKYSTNNCP